MTANSKIDNKKYTYHVWAYRDNGTKFVAKFKDKADAERWAGKTKTRLGKTTDASKVSRKSIRNDPFNFKSMDIGKFKF